MKANEQRKYCGLMQNKLNEITGIFYTSTSTGNCLFSKQDLTSILGIKTVRISANNFIIDVNKTNLKKLNLL